MGSDFAPFDSWFEEIGRSNEYPDSFVHDSWSSVEDWRRHGRALMAGLLAFHPEERPLEPRVHSTSEHDGLVVERLTYDVGYGPRTEALFLRPVSATGRLPGIVALHDHGGFKWWGKEKIVGLPGEPRILKDYRLQYYGGRAWASELARRGYAVFVHDLFQWGSRRADERSISADLVGERFSGLRHGSEEYIRAFHDFMAEYEHVLAKAMFAAGVTWAGVMAYEDRRALDYMLTRPEVDRSAVGCAGLSGGGLRTIYLAGLDGRIACAVCVGYMYTLAGLFAGDKHRRDTWMSFLPHLANHLDLPDVIALRVPAPLMVQLDEEDILFTPASMHDADAKIARIYAKAGRPQNYQGRFYPGPHKFDLEMQEDAFAWFDRHMKQA